MSTDTRPSVATDLWDALRACSHRLPYSDEAVAAWVDFVAGWIEDYWGLDAPEAQEMATQWRKDLQA